MTAEQTRYRLLRQREDLLALFIIALVPSLIALPQLIGVLHADPSLYLSGLTENGRRGWLPGYQYIDPNIGFTTQALGRLAATDWLHGEIPWWNPYSGVGLPLAGEYQPAAFFPPTMLLLLRDGMVWWHLLLQVLAGWGTYGLVRTLGLGRLAALTAGLLFAQNGTLAWFSDAPAGPVPFLPWFLLGIERAALKASLNESGGWRTLAIALAMMLLAGFPETAFICGMFGLAWAVLRLWQCPAACRLGMIWRVALGGSIGLALAAPQILAFLQFLPQAFVGGHADAFAKAALPMHSVVPSLLAPYAYGPIFAYGSEWVPVNDVWGGIGGYVDIVILVVATYGLSARRDALSWVLVAWIVLTLAKTFGFEPVTALWNLVPGVNQVVVARYGTPTWELAVALLAAMGVDALAPGHASLRRGPSFAACGAFAIGLGSLLAYGLSVWSQIESFASSRAWALGSAGWAGATGLLAAILLVGAAGRARARAIAGLLVLDSTIMFALPTLSNPRGGQIDRPALEFLQSHLGLQRFYTLGPLQPNYGAYFGIASINHNYLPVSQRWVDWMRTRLDRAVTPEVFTGNYPRGPHQPSQAQELGRNLSAYEAAGVKYVVAAAGQAPIVQILSTPVRNTNHEPLPLLPGQAVRGVMPLGATGANARVEAAGVLQANYNHTATGALAITLCSGGQCASGSADLAGSRDNSLFWVPLQQPLSLAANTPVEYTILHQGGAGPEAPWVFPSDVDQHVIGPAGPLSGQGLRLRLRLATPGLASRVYTDALVSVYELPDPRPYFEAVGGTCSIDAQSRRRAIASCTDAARLVRRELFFPGWKATINGQPAAITEYDQLFQEVRLGPGQNVVELTYAPPRVIWAWLAMGLASAVLATSIMLSARRLPPRVALLVAGA